MSSPSATSGTARTPSPVSHSSQAFPKWRRLLKRSEFQTVYDQGARASGPLFSVFLHLGGRDAPARVGLTVSRKVGNAVVRARSRRLFREAARRNWDLFPPGAWVVLHARPAMRDSNYAEVERELARCLRRLTPKTGD